MIEPPPWCMICGVLLGWAVGFILSLVIGPSVPVVGVAYMLVGIAIGLGVSLPFEDRAIRRARRDVLRRARKRAQP